MLLYALPQPSISIPAAPCTVPSSVSTIINSSSTNAEKLCHLSAWHMTMNNNFCLMNFSPGGNAICVDTGATCCISNNKADFINYTSSHNKVLHGIGTGLSIAGSGTLRWCILDNSGDEVDLYIHNCLHVPSAPMCLLSPQHMSQQTCNPDDGFHCKNIHGVLTFAGHHRTIHYHHFNNLPIFFTATNLSSAPSSSEHSTITTTALLSSEITDEPSSSLTPSQRKLLHLHNKMGHLNMVHLQQLIRENYFGSNFHSLASCDAPLCHAGDCVSGDQMESSSPGLIPIF
jgi:hypothetical protein